MSDYSAFTTRLDIAVRSMKEALRNKDYDTAALEAADVHNLAYMIRNWIIDIQQSQPQAAPHTPAESADPARVPTQVQRLLEQQAERHLQDQAFLPADSGTVYSPAPAPSPADSPPRSR